MEKYICPKCYTHLPEKEGTDFLCPKCNLKYSFQNNFLKYDFDTLLYDNFRKRYLLNKVLDNNAYISYQLLKEGSLSLPERGEVKRFKEYILKDASGGKILDIGCGTMKIPGYLDFSNKEKFDFYGIDPIDDHSFFGKKVVGCSEFMPYPDNFFKVIIFATSLDHLCSIEKSIDETYRVLEKNGIVKIWMSDLNLEWKTSKITRLINKLKNKIKIFRKSLKVGYRVDKFVRYPKENLVFFVPKGAVDPYHAIQETPKKIIKIFENKGFKLKDALYGGKNEIFITLQK